MLSANSSLLLANKFRFQVFNNQLFKGINRPFTNGKPSRKAVRLLSVYSNSSPLAVRINKLSNLGHKQCYSSNSTPPSTNEKQSEFKTLFKQFNNIPNTLTSLRILSTPVISYFLYQQEYKIFISLFVLSSITDFLDGFIARRYNLKTKLGSIIDPLADKLLIMSTIISMSLIGGPEIIPVWLSATIILKDVILLAKTGLEYGKMKKLEKFGDIKPTFISKFNTFMQLIYIGPICFVILYQRENEKSEEKSKNIFFEYASYFIGITTVLSGLSYIGPRWLRKLLI